MPGRTSHPPPSLDRDRTLARFAAVVWVVFACVIAITVLSKKHLSDRSVTPEYHRAAMQWWESQPLYTEGVHGFLYMPQAAMVYTPFALMPAGAEEITWRIAGILLYAWGILVLCRRFAAGSAAATGNPPSHQVLGPPGNAFLLASILAVFPAMGSAQNGQTNLHMGGLFALGAAAIIDRRWWLATLWLLLALALKPTALVIILLFGALWWPTMSWRLGVGIAVFLLAPLVHPHPGYALGQYAEFKDKVLRAAAPPDLFQDIRGMLESFRIHLPEPALTAIRGAAAVATLGLCWLATRRFPAAVAALFTLTLGTIYLMLFNPRTEGVSYAILGPAAAIWATREIVARRWVIAVPLIAFCLILQFSRLITAGDGNYWVRPLTTLAFATLVVCEIFRRRTGWFGASDTRCANCGYDLSGLASARCPECGRVTPPRSRATPEALPPVS
jgi:alpha-1,2-mannosyltransferase